MFRDMKPLDRDQHRCLRLAPNQPFLHAAKEMLVSVVAAEASQIAREYVIVFPGGESGLPAALLGAQEGVNAYVNEQGQWVGRYIPAVVRRYPFQLLSRGPVDEGKAGETRFAILIDESAPHLAETAGERLFTDAGEPTATLLRVQQVLTALEQERVRTNALVSQLDQQGLLVDRVVKIQPSGQDVRQVSGLRVIDPKRLNGLTADALKALHTTGALELAYAHLLSLSNLRDGWLAKRSAAPQIDIMDFSLADPLNFNLH
ncbi:SapC family protein [Thiorhodococcus minor]|uniref:SapC family protein n=1 Tax=Thiorhodococcus minor TaxID=57489 RepID=A0A6M0JVC1_9GAMM|nr:SapC family protein [Thiorhodococcus minor]NEV61119.1 SapC family protein [Thiorhodococcus minor]